MYYKKYGDREFFENGEDILIPHRYILLPGMGRPRMYRPHKATKTEEADAENLLGAVKHPIEASDFLDFVAMNREAHGQRRSRSELLALYKVQLTKAGMRPSTIRTRMEIAESIHVLSDHPLESRTASAVVKQATVECAMDPPMKKESLPLKKLLSPMQPAATHRRDQLFQALWWVLLVTGGRPNNVRKSRMVLKADRVDVTWGGRKSSKSSVCVSYLLRWGEEGGVQLSDFTPRSEDVNHALQEIGTPANVASCVNSWLKQWTAKHHPGSKTNLTSTLPRVRLDRILRRELAMKRITDVDFQTLMDHDVKTSNVSYAPILDVGGTEDRQTKRRRCEK